MQRGGACLHVHNNYLPPIIRTASVWKVVVVTTERYITVCWSLHAAKYITMLRVRIAVSVVWISSFIMNIPTCITWKVGDEYSYCNIGHIGLIHITREYILWYAFLFKLFIVFLLPLSLLLLFNSCIIRAIRRSSDVTRQLTSRVVTDRRQTSSIERRCTWMMIAVITVFIVCQLPQAVYVYFVYFVKLIASGTFDGKQPPIVRVQFSILLRSVTVLLLTVNSVANFFIYFLLGTRFRQILSTFIRCQHRTRLSFKT